MSGDCGSIACRCPEALERLQEYLDGELGDAQYAEIATHLANCYPCGDRADFEAHLREVVRMYATEVAPVGLLEKVRARCFQTAEGFA